MFNERFPPFVTFLRPEKLRNGEERWAFKERSKTKESLHFNRIISMFILKYISKVFSLEILLKLSQGDPVEHPLMSEFTEN